MPYASQALENVHTVYGPDTIAANYQDYPIQIGMKIKIFVWDITESRSFHAVLKAFFIKRKGNTCNLVREHLTLIANISQSNIQTNVVRLMACHTRIN